MRAAIAIAVPILFSTLLLLTIQLSKPPDPQTLKNKVFVLGLSKTGTTSTGIALSKLGYRVLGWKDIRSRHLVHAHIHNQLEPLIHITKYYDAFEDLPWPGLYREMAAVYPDAKFVLTLRRDEQTWLNSMRRHMARGYWGPAEFWYGAQYVEGSEEIVLGRYRNHTESVRAFFAGEPERYVELVVDDGDVNWERLCRVADCPDHRAPAMPFPKSNTAADWRDGDFRGEFVRMFRNMLTLSEAAIADLYFGGDHPTVNAVLEAMWLYISSIDLALQNIYCRFQLSGVEMG